MEKLFETLKSILIPSQSIKDEINRDFRKWHVEALLNQAADLMDRCLDELRDLRSLLFAREQF